MISPTPASATRLWAPTPPAMTHSERIGYLTNYGIHPMAFSTMQPGMEYFDLPGIGYIAYARYLGMQFALSDPICDARHVGMLLDRFVRRFPSAMFAQVTKRVADFLHHQHGYYGTQFGSESKIPLADWNLRGSKKQIIRTAVNQAKAQGVEIEEGPFDEQAKEISESWIATRRCKSNEIRFLVRPMLMDFTQGTRHFYARRHGKAVGFIFFDPTYRDGKVAAYVPNISRSCASFKQGLWYAIMVHAMEVFRAEGIEYMDMGLTPLMLADELEAQESKPLRLIQKQIYAWGNSLYNFKGLEFAKSRFQGQVVKTYFCHRRRLPGLGILAMFRLTRLI